MKPQVAFKNFKKFIKNDPIQITTKHGTSFEKYSIKKQFPEIFRTQKPLKFHLFDFNNKFDWLLGLDNLKLLKAKCDFENDLLITPKRHFKIYYKNLNIKIKILNNIQLSKNELSKFRMEHLDSKEKFLLTKLINNYLDIIKTENCPLSFTHKIKHSIKLTDETPIFTKSYRYPEVHRNEVKRQISEMLSQKIIRPSFSPWCSPIWIVPKKLDSSGNKKWRIVTDFRKLNQNTISDKYPIPNINELLDKLDNCRYFSTLDLASGFHQIEMEDSDISKTAFNVENGHYEFLRMPFGLKNAPSTFQRVMDNILRGLNNEICLVYLDDIIIFSANLQEHMIRLRTVFDRLKDANFKIQLDKCEFLKKEVAFLGHIITPDGKKPNPDKIKAIQNFPIPKTVKEIKSFLGLVGYYRKFINNFAQITKPLTKALKKNAVIDINNVEYRECFETCKNLLTNDPILQYPNFNEVFHLTTDASNYAIGAVISQGPIGQDRPIAYASRTLNEHEVNYSTIEKELCAIVWGVKYFRPYLFGREFNILSDHKPLVWLANMKTPNSKIIRWKTQLEEFDYKITHIAGSKNKVADPLSRIRTTDLNINETDPISPIILEYMKNFNDWCKNPTGPPPNPPEKSPSETHSYPSFEELINTNVNPDLSCSPISNLPIGSPESIINPLDTLHSLPKEEIITIKAPINKFLNQIVINLTKQPSQKISIEKKFGNKYQRFIINTNENNFEKFICKFIKEYLVPRVNYYVFSKNEIHERLTQVISRHFKKYELKLFLCDKILEDIEDLEDRKTVLEQYHFGKTNHRGIMETYEKLKVKYFWPKLKESIQEFINNCDVCQISKYDRHPLKPKFNLTPTACKPFEVMHKDTLTLEKHKFLTIIDTFSKFAMAYPLNSLHSLEIINNLLDFFTHHGIPKFIASDNGGEFKNKNLQEFLHEIQIHFTSSQCNIVVCA